MLAMKEGSEADVAASEPGIIFISVEMSRSKWIVGCHTPLADKISCHSMDWGDVANLRALIDRQLDRVQAKLQARPSVLCCYEAGYEGFWLQRLLASAGFRALVIDPASLLVNRRAKRAKTDRIDAHAMIRALMAYERGEDQVLSAVHIPTVDQDDERRLLRERQRLVKERTAHTNRIKGLLMTQGIVGFDPRSRDAVQRLDMLVTGDGRQLGHRLKDEITRELARLLLVMEQLAAVETERDLVAAPAVVPVVSADCPGREVDIDGDARMIASLYRLKGVGANDASVLVREAFWRKFRNRRELGAWSGLAPTPWSSGAVVREQGITKAGPPVFRAHMIQISWRWLHWQPQSGLAQWFAKRTQGASGRMRRVMIVAMARKLMIALWRYATTGLVPHGAIVG